MLDPTVYGLEGKVAIVTGGSDGIGKGIALEMAKAGANIVIAARNPDRADAAADEIRAVGNKVLRVTADVQKSRQVDNVVKQTLQEFGTIDILVNNVGGMIGVTGDVPFMETSEDFFDGIININLKSTFICTKAVVKVMIEEEKKGSIINISSIVGLGACLTSPVYGAANAAIINLTMSLAAELGKYNIRVNSIAPSNVTTPLTDELYRGRMEARQIKLKFIPLGRFGLPEDIGKVAVFLASGAAGFVSGHTIVVGGGLQHPLPAPLISSIFSELPSTSGTG